ncbi:NAD(P)/FAD-dependent oxidoreductase [bacterium]|nr:MAG: NAD(P)/FAD-dependent oxidoreductase [bacterium]
MRRIVVIGGGFGGLYFAKQFKKSDDVQVTLIDKRNHHLFQPLLYQVATGGLSPGDIAYPLRSVLAKKKHIRVVQDEVIDISKEEKTVITKKTKYSFDALVIAAGASNFYFGNDGWEKVAPGLKSIEDAIEMRAHILKPLESAEIETDSIRQKALMTYVVIGGGPTGVELCGAIAELTQSTLKGTYRAIQSNQAKIIMIEAGPRVLSTFSEKLSGKAYKKLIDLGVDVRTKTRVTKIEKGWVEIESEQGKERIESEAILWGAGVKSSSLGVVLKNQFGAELDRAGRVIVNDKLQIPGVNTVFVLGDMAFAKDVKGNPLPGTAPVAMQQGGYLAKNMLSILNGKSVKPFNYLDKGSLAVIGRNEAIASIFGMQLSGFPAWVIWIFIHIAYLIGFDNRAMVLFQWAWNYITRKRGALLITE